MADTTEQAEVPQAKKYNKNQHAGNINKWDENNFKTIGQVNMHEKAAETLNASFGGTGIKYVLVEAAMETSKPADAQPNKLAEQPASPLPQNQAKPADQPAK